MKYLDHNDQGTGLESPIYLNDSDIFFTLNYSSNSDKKKEKRRKANRRRNELRRNSWKKIKRWSKGSFHNNHNTLDSKYLKDFLEFKERIDYKIFDLTMTWNIILLFRLYWIELKETYNFYKWICPFHEETKPSFTISKGKWVIKCFGCWKWGRLINMTFMTKFGLDITRKNHRIKELEEDVNRFIKLDPITKFWINHTNIQKKPLKRDTDYDDISPF